jgi:hypothetical protein
MDRGLFDGVRVDCKFHGRFRISGCVHLARATYSYSIGEQAAVRRPKFQRRCLVDLPDAFDALWGVECLP